MLYDVDEHIQIPGIAALRYGVRPTSATASRRTGAASTTTTAGSWSRSTSTWISATRGSTPNDPFYPEAMTGLAYRFAVNYVIYAMTH